MARITSTLIGIMLLFAAAVVSAQWPQWRGPGRNAVVTAANVPASWPAQPTLKWNQKVGEGYSSPVVADGRIFVHSRQDPDEIVTALELSTGKPVWRARYQSAFNKNKYAMPRDFQHLSLTGDLRPCRERCPRA